MKKQVLHHEDFTQPYNVEEFGQKSHWLLPQALAWIGSKLPLAKGVSGKMSFKLSLAQWKTQQLPQLDNGNVISLLWIKNLFEVLNCAPRGQVLGKLKQATLLGSRYAANVPLILSAFKEYRNIPYSMWDFSEPEHVLFLDKDIQQLVPYFGVQQPWDAEELLEFQRLGRLVQSGASMGKIKAIETCTSITGVYDVEFKKLPRLMKLLLCQTWVYSPQVRNKYAITDLMNLDQPAQPLVDSDLFDTRGTKTDSLNSDPSKTDSKQFNLDEMWL